MNERKVAALCYDLEIYDGNQYVSKKNREILIRFWFHETLHVNWADIFPHNQNCRSNIALSTAKQNALKNKSEYESQRIKTNQSRIKTSRCKSSEKFGERPGTTPKAFRKCLFIASCNPLRHFVFEISRCLSGLEMFRGFSMRNFSLSFQKWGKASNQIVACRKLISRPLHGQQLHVTLLAGNNLMQAFGFKALNIL